jgi:hypothetical protein
VTASVLRAAALAVLALVDLAEAVRAVATAYSDAARASFATIDRKG